MIYSQMDIYDIDPYTWKRLEEVWQRIEPPKKKLYLLEQNGCVIRAVRECGRVVDFQTDENGQINSVGIESAFRQNKDVDQIWVMSREGLIRFEQTVGTYSGASLDTDDFISMSWKILNEVDGIQIHDRELNHRNKDLWSKLRKVVNYRLDPDHAVAIVLFEEQKLYFHIVLEFQGRKLSKMTTLDHYPEWSNRLADLRVEDREAIDESVRKQFNGNVTTLTMEKKAFFEWVDRTL